ncbi:hypothetical protein [Haloactinospora alba]|nr:hypothetical protein [Haloactinospora alba]
MDATTGTAGPLQGVDDIDWGALAPERGSEIPELLRGVRGGDDPARSVATLYDILRFPGAGYPAAPTASGFLVDIACDPETADPGQALSLLLELVAPTAADHFPRRLDLEQWRADVAWAGSTDVETVRGQYRTWRDEAGDEQQYRRMSSRLDAVSRPNGVTLLEAELATYDAVRKRVPELVALLTGRGNRRRIAGSVPPAEWVCYLLAFLPDAETAQRSVTAITAASSLLQPPSRNQQQSPRAEESEPLSAELFALGALAGPEDATVTVALAHQMTSGHLYNTFAAAVALTVIHGSRVPSECLTRIAEGGRTRVGYHGLFEDSWPHCGEIQPEVLGFLALERGGERTRRTRLDMAPDVLAHSEDAGSGIAAGAALDMVLGPRTAARTPVPEENAELDTETLEVLWAIAELPEPVWTESDVGATVAAWGLPGDRAEFRAFAGVTDGEEENDRAAGDNGGSGDEGRQPDTAGPARSGGLFARLFGGGS